MAAILGNITLGYHNLIHERSDPRVKDLPLMNNPFSFLLILIGYHYFVGHLGPRIMQNRASLDIYYPMLVYNFVQIGINSLVVYKTFELKWLQEGFSLSCDPVDYSNDPRALSMLWCAWIFFAVKILDLLDTVFMVLRKKTRQVTFLHRYHHIGTVFAGWIGAKYVGGGHSVFFGTINSFVHVIMYCYYQLLLSKPEYGSNLWWKKHITQLQLVQFLFMVAYYSITLLNTDCSYPKLVAMAFIPQNIFMLVLFLDFYRKSYHRNHLKDQKKY